MNRHWRALAIFPLLLIGAWMLREFEQQMLFPAPTLPYGWLAEQAKIQGAEELSLKAEDGVALYGWHLQASGQRRGVVLWFEGNGGSVGMRPREFHRLQETGWDVVQLNYRGYPGSEGAPSEVGLRRDARAAWAFAAAIDPRVWIIGKSLGGGVAVGLAAERPAMLLTVESSFTSISAVANSLWHIPLGYLVVNRFDSLELAPQVKAPSLVLHGEVDPLIPVSHGRELAAALHADFLPIPGAAHSDPLLFDHWDRVAAWLSQHVGG